MLSMMIKFKQIDLDVVKAVKNLVVAESEKGFHKDITFTLRKLAMISPVKDEEFLRKMEPILLENLDKLETYHFESLLKAFKLWNHISEPIYARLIHTGINSPDKFKLEELVCLLHVLGKQGVHNSRLIASARKRVGAALKELWQLPPSEALEVFPLSTASMYLACLSKIDLIDKNTIALVEGMVLKCIDLSSDTVALHSLLSTHTAWVSKRIKENKAKFHKDKEWKKCSEEFYEKVLKRLVELKSELTGTAILSIITNTNIGSQRKKEKATAILQLAAEGFKKLESREEYKDEEDMKMQVLILETDLYNQARKYCNNATKRQMLHDAIQNTSISHLSTPDKLSEKALSQL